MPRHQSFLLKIKITILSPSLSLSLFLSLSLSPSLFLTLSFFLSLSLPLSHSFSLSLSLPFSPSFSLSHTPSSPVRERELEREREREKEGERVACTHPSFSQLHTQVRAYSKCSSCGIIILIVRDFPSKVLIKRLTLVRTVFYVAYYVPV